MKNVEKIVTQIPISELWNEEGKIAAKRKRYLNDIEIQKMLKENVLVFVVADTGKNLQWISNDKNIEFWKTELKPHLCNDVDTIIPDNFPDNYTYVASEWEGNKERTIILLEKYH